jgi:hypothetical protein
LGGAAWGISVRAVYFFFFSNPLFLYSVYLWDIYLFVSEGETFLSSPAWIRAPQRGRKGVHALDACVYDLPRAQYKSALLCQEKKCITPSP